jgi:hypothetical protein
LEHGLFHPRPAVEGKEIRPVPSERAIRSASSLSSAEQFDAEYPEELADRLAWLERRLRISTGAHLAADGSHTLAGSFRNFRPAVGFTDCGQNAAVGSRRWMSSHQSGQNVQWWVERELKPQRSLSRSDLPEIPRCGLPENVPTVNPCSFGVQESRLWDSNPRPALYESAALPAELSRRGPLTAEPE